MGRPFTPLPVPVLEVTVRIHLAPNRDRLVIECLRALGANETVSCYHDQCSVPPHERILAEMISAMEMIVLSEVQNRWGIQQTL